MVFYIKERRSRNSINQFKWNWRKVPLYTLKKNYGPYHLISSSRNYMKPKDISARAHETENVIIIIKKKNISSNMRDSWRNGLVYFVNSRIKYIINNIERLKHVVVVVTRSIYIFNSIRCSYLITIVDLNFYLNYVKRKKKM